MIASLNILFQTRKTFDYLDDQFEDDLETNCTFIFGLLGAIGGLNSFFKERAHFIDFSDSRFLILFLIAAIAFGAVFGVLIGKYLQTYVLFGVGRLLKGSAEVIDIRVVAAYSLIPGILRLPVIIYLGTTDNASLSSEFFLIINILTYIIWIWTLKIMLQGIMRFNKFGILKALINISPILIPGLIWGGIRLLG